MSLGGQYTIPSQPSDRLTVGPPLANGPDRVQPSCWLDPPLDSRGSFRIVSGIPGRAKLLAEK